MECAGVKGNRRIQLSVPQGCIADLILDAREQVSLKKADGAVDQGLTMFRVPAGSTNILTLRYT
jgi:hypothetical protein